MDVVGTLAAVAVHIDRLVAAAVHPLADMDTVTVAAALVGNTRLAGTVSMVAVQGFADNTVLAVDWPDPALQIQLEVRQLDEQVGSAAVMHTVLVEVRNVLAEVHNVPVARTGCRLDAVLEVGRTDSDSPPLDHAGWAVQWVLDRHRRSWDASEAAGHLHGHCWNLVLMPLCTEAVCTSGSVLSVAVHRIGLTGLEGVLSSLSALVGWEAAGCMLEALLGWQAALGPVPHPLASLLP